MTMHPHYSSAFLSAPTVAAGAGGVVSRIAFLILPVVEPLPFSNMTFIESIALSMLISALRALYDANMAFDCLLVSDICSIMY